MASDGTFIGIDIGAETVKLAELRREGGELRWGRREIVEHHKEPAAALRLVLARLRWEEVEAAAVSGRFSRQVNLPRIPVKVAQARAVRFLFGSQPATVVSIGSHGFSVLELRGPDVEVFRENSRCSQGTGSFLRQLVERFDLTIGEASRLAETVTDPAPLSGRCPVILKTDMTHLANKGVPHPNILAGLFDAVCENVQALIKPQLSPPRVFLIGGVSRSARVRSHFRRFLARHRMSLVSDDDDDALYFEALGCALAAAETPAPVPAIERLWTPEPAGPLESVPALSDYFDQVRRLQPLPLTEVDGHPRRLLLGLDIGSTGSKVVAFDLDCREAIWESYRETLGDPVGAAQALVRRFAQSPWHRHPTLAVGVTGSGREIVGSLLATCYGAEATFVLNEIAAHAAGAVYHDPAVDTIFEIGGQDAKYIRLAEGRVVDAAMNEACSAGTGSFIAEQGKRFSGIRDVEQLGREALASSRGVSLGQHCSVFMAEVIDEAIARGIESGAIIAGIYDSIVQNYLNRVKGNRTVGKVIFCQGMPFSAPALAAAVARQTRSRVIVPPSPGCVGALGIALLACENLRLESRSGLDLERFLGARIEKKSTFVCKSSKGCGGAGNKCRIDQIQTVVDGRRQRFTWGGACSLHDRGTGKRKLPDGAPNPFREREELVQEIIRPLTAPRGRRRIAVTDEFVLKGLFPFFATFLYELGLDLVIRTGADRRALQCGVERANVAFCAPMQHYHGLVTMLAEEAPEYLFLPMLRSLPRIGREPNAVCCPVAQGSPDVLRWDLGSTNGVRILSPVIDMGPGNLRSAAFRSACSRLAAELGVRARGRERAFEAALAAQSRFDARCPELGREALAFCARRQVVPVVVLGRSYTIYNNVLNSNVPALVREQGALPIPVDCYPVDEEVPTFEDVYWGYGQRNLRAAHQIRRTPGVYSLFCSNYACGPDSFNLHFYSHIMDGKPFAVIETDGHAGDAGTKTRVEAFLYCVHEDLTRRCAPSRPHAFELIERTKGRVAEMKRRGDILLVPRMSESAEAVTACLRGTGLRVECLPRPDREALQLGRRHTSGKECLPLCITLGSYLQRLARESSPDRRFALVMPKTRGPCRFGLYNLLQKVILERLGWSGRATVWSPDDSDYFAELGRGFGALLQAGLGAHDLLSEALYHVRPVESAPGRAQAIYRRWTRELVRHLEQEASRPIPVWRAVVEVDGGRLFGCAEILRQAAAEFAAVKGPREVPTVLLTGEIYVRCDPFACDFLIDKLEERGLRVRFAPVSEWLEYVGELSIQPPNRGGLGPRLAHHIQRRIFDRSYAVMAESLDWPPRTSANDALAAAAPYIRSELHGEAVLTVGGAVHERRQGEIAGAVSVGPLECMPTKLAEAQFFHVAEREGLKSLTLTLNGDPIDRELIDNFAFEVHADFHRHRTSMPHAKPAPGCAMPDPDAPRGPSPPP